MLKPYSDWVNDNIESEFARYWRIYPGDDGREPYLVYCKDDLFAEHAIRGRSVRVRSGSEALGFFTRITGKTAQLLPSSELNAAFELGIIDCIGFGGELVEVAAPASEPDAFDPTVVDTVLRTLGVQASDETFDWKPGTLEWSIYRATNGDLNEIYNLYATHRSYGVNAKVRPFVHMAGFWAVRAFEYTERGGRLQYDDLLQAAKGNCEGRADLCKAIQIELKRIGRYAGAIDGIIGRGTRQAIDAIVGTRQAGNLRDIASLDAFLAARQPAPTDARPDDVGDKTVSDAKGAEPSAAPDSLLTLPQNLDDF
ncbi:hypothetical protein SAMN02982931_01962 [Bauldia litoralis]|uniref:Peptidoglycan binding domain-containing protein n=1 Tax=Bauldia litoralis TaxID=665467 RepID=A0A1G6BXC1_9HYPH|nr:hypothetical protein SAMN02982931_01962 [Bauldia litoralis]